MNTVSVFTGTDQATGQGQSGQLSCQEKADVIEIQSVGGVFTVDKRKRIVVRRSGR